MYHQNLEPYRFKVGAFLRHSVMYSSLFYPPHPCLATRSGNPLEFLDKTYPTKTRRMGLPYVKISWSYVQPLLHESPVWRKDRRAGDSICCCAL